MTTQNIVKLSQQETIEQSLVRSIISFYENRFGTMPEGMRAVIEATHDKSRLRVWRRLAATHDADELATAIDDYEFREATKDLVEAVRQEVIQEGVNQGIAQGIARSTARSLIDVYEARFGAMPDDLRAVIDGTHDELVLRGWLKLASTHSADEIAAAVHPARAS